MSFDEVLAALHSLTFEERQTQVRMALELDDSSLSAADVKLVDARLAEHHDDPNSSASLQELKNRLESQ